MRNLDARVKRLEVQTAKDVVPPPKVIILPRDTRAKTEERVVAALTGDPEAWFVEFVPYLGEGMNEFQDHSSSSNMNIPVGNRRTT